MDEPTYQESVRIGWTLLWRCVGGFLALLFAVNLLLLFAMPELTRTQPSLWISLLPVSVAGLISLFLIMPIIVRALLTKSFHGFHLRFVRDHATETGGDEPRHAGVRQETADGARI